MKLIKTIFGFALLFSASYCSPLHSQGFIEFFDYDPGNISTSSNGAWTSFGSGGPEIQIENCRCLLGGPGGRSAYRPIGDTSVNDIWFYAVEIFVSGTDNQPVKSKEFIHFTNGSVTSFEACLSIEPATNANKDFGLSIRSSSASANQTNWNGDFDFQDRVVAVVKLNSNSGTANLWVNPQLIDNPEKQNPSVENFDPDFPMTAVANLALRQCEGSSDSGTIVTINRLVTGLDFGVLLPIEFDFLIQPGDINRDCRVNLLDVAPFVELLINGDYDPVADLNLDGVVDILDIQPLVDVIVG